MSPGVPWLGEAEAAGRCGRCRSGSARLDLPAGDMGSAARGCQQPPAQVTRQAQPLRPSGLPWQRSPAPRASSQRDQTLGGLGCACPLLAREEVSVNGLGSDENDLRGVGEMLLLFAASNIHQVLPGLIV